MLIAMILQMPVFFKGIRLILCHKLFLEKVHFPKAMGVVLTQENTRIPK